MNELFLPRTNLFLDSILLKACHFLNTVFLNMKGLVSQENGFCFFFFVKLHEIWHNTAALRLLESGIYIHYVVSSYLLR